MFGNRQIDASTDDAVRGDIVGGRARAALSRERRCDFGVAEWARRNSLRPAELFAPSPRLTGYGGGIVRQIEVQTEMMRPAAGKNATTYRLSYRNSLSTEPNPL